MHNDQICTPFELKQFAFTDNTSAYDFARWVKSKSNDKYTVMEVQLIVDMLATISHIATSSYDLNKSLRDKWQKELEIMDIE